MTKSELGIVGSGCSSHHGACDPGVRLRNNVRLMITLSSDTAQMLLPTFHFPDQVAEKKKAEGNQKTTARKLGRGFRLSALPIRRSRSPSIYAEKCLS